MKIIKYTTVISLIILFASCSITKKMEKKIVGKWEITSLKLDDNKKLSDTFSKVTNDMLKGSYIDFKSDKTFDFSILNQVQSGTWQISEDGKKILTPDNGNSFEIVSLVENVLTLKSVKKSKTVLMVLKKK